MKQGGEMYKDPQDIFRDMDEMFAHLYTHMTREFAGRESRVFGYPDILERERESSIEPGLPHEELRAGSEPGVEVHRIDDEEKVLPHFLV
jgi:hypothetical protein